MLSVVALPPRQNLNHVVGAVFATALIGLEH